MKTIKIIISCFMFISLFSINIMAEEEPKINNISEMKGVSTLEIHGVTISLYDVFENRDLAFSKMKVEFDPFLKYLSSNYELVNFTSSTIRDYADVIYTNHDNLLNAGYSNEELSTYTSNLSSYYLEDINNEIINLNNIYLDTGNEEYLMYIDLISPSYSEKIYHRPQTISYFNRTSAINYANKYAYSANFSQYEKLSSDCTNFASQIAHAAGIPLLESSSIYNGWWYKFNLDPNSNLYYSYSNSWIRANSFVNWYGVSYKYVGTAEWRVAMSRHESFSNTVSAGDFIALDYDSNGEWDHIGFVTSKGGYGTYRNDAPAGSASGWGFTNYKVAQHSTDYNLWASDWNGMNWPGAFEHYNTIAIIRTPM